MRNWTILSTGCMAALIACAAPAPYPLPVNSRSQTAPPVVAYAGNLNTYRVTLTDGNTASPIVGTEVPYMAWSTNNTAAVNSTGACSIVSGATGVFDVAFSPASVNFTAGRYIYEVGVKSNGVPRTYRQGTFQIVGSPVGGSVGSVNWTTNLNWGAIVWGGLPTITVNGQPFGIGTNSEITVTAAPAPDDVARASIAALSGRMVDSVNGSTGAVTVATTAQGAKADTALQFESDPIALAVLSTQQVTRVWSSDGTQFVETGVVWQASQVTTYTVALSADFLDFDANTRPEWSTHVWPVSEGGWLGLHNIDRLNFAYSGSTAVWVSDIGFSYPCVLSPNENGQGTAVVSQFISTVYSPVKAYASESNLTAVDSKLNNHVATNAASVIAQAQPSTLMRYADFATTNTAGYAAFTNANPAQKTRIISSPTLGTSLAKARWTVASTLAGTLSVSAYVQSGALTPPTSNCAAYAVLTLYTAGGAVVASNIGATVSIDRGAVSNISATVALSAPATNGYVVAEVFSGTNAVSLVGAVAGGSYPFALSALNSPLAYLTLAQATALFALKDNGVQVNPTVAGVLDVKDAISLGGVTYTNLATGGDTYVVSGGGGTVLTPITNLTAGATTTINVTPTQQVYKVAATSAVSLFTNNVSALALTGTSNAEWQVWLDVIDWPATNVTWANNIEWQNGSPELTVTGCYKFAFSTIGGAVHVKQTYPQTERWAVAPWNSGGVDTAAVYNDLGGLTNTVYYKSLYNNQKIVVKTRWFNSLNFTHVGELLVGATYYVNAANQTVFSTNSISVSALGNYPLKLGVLPLDDTSIESGQLTRTAFIFIKKAMTESNGNVTFWYGEVLHRPANELEIKAFNAGWHP